MAVIFKLFPARLPALPTDFDARFFTVPRRRRGRGVVGGGGDGLPNVDGHNGFSRHEIRPYDDKA